MEQALAYVCCPADESRAKMLILQDTILVVKQLHQRHFQEVPINIFLHSWDLHRQMIPRYWDSVSFIIHRVFIMAEP